MLGLNFLITSPEKATDLSAREKMENKDVDTGKENNKDEENECDSSLTKE